MRFHGANICVCACVCIYKLFQMASTVVWGAVDKINSDGCDSSSES